jgi:hypothetical protein
MIHGCDNWCGGAKSHSYHSMSMSSIAVEASSGIVCKNMEREKIAFPMSFEMLFLHLH